MKIEPGYYRCRNGSRARVLCTDAPGDYPVVGYVESSPGQSGAMEWKSDGMFSRTPQRYDLIEPWCDEPAHEVSMILTMQQIRKLVTDAAYAGHMDVLLSEKEVDDVLIKAGILPAPAQQQPVRVSGWLAVFEYGYCRLNETKDEADSCLFYVDGRYLKKACIVYVDNEGVGPEGKE